MRLHTRSQAGSLIWYGRRESTPPQAFSALRIFGPTTGFTAAKLRLWSGLSLHSCAYALGAAAQFSREIAPGIIRYDTACHGGYYLAPARVASMPKPLREFNPWAGPNWYEENCDRSVVALAFPQFFPPEDLPLALATLRNYRPDVYDEYMAAEAERAGGRSA
jgi:hypothetical protein